MDNQKFQKRHTNVHVIKTIKNHLADHREQHIGKDENYIIAEDISVDFLEYK